MKPEQLPCIFPAGKRSAKFGSSALPLQIAMITSVPTRVEHMLDEILELTGGAGRRAGSWLRS
jgi:hypothetical protein